MINLGLYRSGTTTLAKAFSHRDLKPFRELFSTDLDASTLRSVLLQPEIAILDWWNNGGQLKCLTHILEYDLLCDGWYALLAFLPTEHILSLVTSGKKQGLDIIFVCTWRENVNDIVKSELHHWVRHDLESRCNLTLHERNQLGKFLKIRAEKHRARILSLQSSIVCKILKLNQDQGPEELWAPIL